MYCDCHCTAIHSWFYCHSKFCHSCRSHFKRERSLWGYTPEACGRHTLSVKVHSRGALRQKLLKAISPYFTVHTVYQNGQLCEEKQVVAWFLCSACTQWLHTNSGFCTKDASTYSHVFNQSCAQTRFETPYFPSTSATVLFCNCRPTKQESILFGLNYLWHSITC